MDALEVTIDVAYKVLGRNSSDVATSVTTISREVTADLPRSIEELIAVIDVRTLLPSALACVSVSRRCLHTE